MTTLNDLVYDVLSYMSGFGKDRDKETYLTSAMSLTDASFYVDEPGQVDRGIVEIGTEQMTVRAVDEPSRTVTLMPYGRGRNGTTAATHATGDRIVSNPSWPTSQIANEINRIVKDIFPALYAVKVDTSQTYQPMMNTYQLPADCYTVISVASKNLGSTGSWQNITRYSYDPIAYSGQFATQRGLTIRQPAAPGQIIKVVYRAEFGEFASPSDTMASIGLREEWRDIITMGVQARLIGTLDMNRLQQGSVESVERAQTLQPMMASQVSKDLRSQYEMRKHEESLRLAQVYSSNVVRSV